MIHFLVLYNNKYVILELSCFLFWDSCFLLALFGIDLQLLIKIRRINMEYVSELREVYS